MLGLEFCGLRFRVCGFRVLWVMFRVSWIKGLGFVLGYNLLWWLRILVEGVVRCCGYGVK